MKTKKVKPMPLYTVYFVDGNEATDSLLSLKDARQLQRALKLDGYETVLGKYAPKEAKRNTGIEQSIDLTQEEHEAFFEPDRLVRGKRLSERW
jgi:hypothetical protein